MQALMQQYGSTELKTGATLAELIKRPELSYQALAPLDTHRPQLREDIAEQVNINLKYEGYIERQLRQVEHFKSWKRELSRKRWTIRQLTDCVWRQCRSLKNSVHIQSDRHPEFQAYLRRIFRFFWFIWSSSEEESNHFSSENKENYQYEFYRAVK